MSKIEYAKLVLLSLLLYAFWVLAIGQLRIEERQIELDRKIDIGNSAIQDIHTMLNNDYEIQK